MYAVVRHTYQLDIPDPSNPNSTKSSAKWVHLVWVFDTELDALSFAISLLDDPLIRANEYMLDSAINQIKQDKFYQVGRESVAIAQVEDSPEIIYEEIEEIYYDNNDKKSIH
tara:strand:- start:2455 stop:2790 length:336 start_codon:yes stop_codon:yes gene_type:complete